MKFTCQICGKEIDNKDFDAGLVEIIEGSDFIMYHHMDCSKRHQEKRAAEKAVREAEHMARLQKAKEEHADFFQGFYDEVDAAQDYEEVSSVIRKISMKSLMELERIRESGVYDGVQSFRDAIAMANGYAREKANKLKPKVEKSADAIDFMDALAIGAKEADRYADC